MDPSLQFIINPKENRGWEGVKWRWGRGEMEMGKG